MGYLSRFSSLALLALIILLSGCAPTQVTTVKPNTDSTEIVSDTNYAVNTVIAPTLAMASDKNLSCPKIDENVQFNIPSDSKVLDSIILDYLNHGGNPAKIEIATSSKEFPPFHVAYADIDEDLLPELLVSTIDLFEKPATIRIYHCEQNNYHLVKSFTPQNMGSGIIEFVSKIFSSEPPYAIIRAPLAIGWGQDFLAVGWHNSEWQIINLATGSTPAEIALFDQNMDGIKEVFIETRTAATPGGGISRVIIDTYSWNGNKFAYVNSTMPPGSDRVHYLDDAENAWKQGNPLLSVSYYEIAARASNISSYATTYELEHKQTELAEPYQRSFAFFRIVAIWFYLDRPEVASQYIQEMSDTFLQGEPGNEFVLAAKKMDEEFKTEANFASSCSKAVYLLDTQYPDIVRNHLGDWGVANLMYFATSDICKLD